MNRARTHTHVHTRTYIYTRARTHAHTAGRLFLSFGVLPRSRSPDGLRNHAFRQGERENVSFPSSSSCVLFSLNAVESTDRTATDRASLWRYRSHAHHESAKYELTANVRRRVHARPCPNTTPATGSRLVVPALFYCPPPVLVSFSLSLSRETLPISVPVSLSSSVRPLLP